jgi:hypothetical protein
MSLSSSCVLEILPQETESNMDLFTEEKFRFLFLPAVGSLTY